MLVLRSRPRLRGAKAWALAQRRLSKYLLAEYTFGLGAAQIGSMLVPVLGTTRDAGAIRGAQTLLGPLNVLGTATLAFAVPEISRRRDLGPVPRLKSMAVLSAAMGTISAFYVAVLLLLPDPVGRELFGESWSGAQSVLLPMGINALAAAVGTGPGAMLIGMGLARKAFKLSLLKAPVLFGCLVPGTLVAGAPGAAWGMAISELFFLPLLTVTSWRAAHGRYQHLIEDLDPAPSTGRSAEETSSGPC